MKRGLLLFGIVIFSSGMFAQGGKKQISGLIIGNVIDSLSGKGMPDVTIQLISLNDSVANKTLIADKNGGFEINDILFGWYRLHFSSVGFSPLTIDSINIRQDRFDFNIGDVRLKTYSSELETIVIFVEKPLIESRDGKIIYNVGESALSSGSSTSELLKNMPLISNDANGKILLKGKEPKILIDDKPTDLNAQQLADLLESLPGSSIEKIELMSNPPPQYASESGGVINIVTKKGRVGLTGRIIASYGSRGEANLSLNVSYRNKKFILNGTAGSGAGRTKGEGSSYRQNFYPDSANFFQTSNIYINKSLRPNARVSADYEFNKRNQLNFTTQFNSNIFDNESLTNYKNLNRFEDIYRWSTRSNNTDGNNINPSFSSTYTHRGKNVRELLVFIASYNIGKNQNHRTFFQQFLNPDKTPTGFDSTQHQETNNKSSSWSLRLNYDKPLSRRITLSTGITSGRSIFHNILTTEFLKKPENVFINNTFLSQDFYFYQTVHTLRSAIIIDLEKRWRIIGGVQAENTRTRFAFKNMQSNFDNNYWNWLPNFTLRKEWQSGWNTSLVYRKSIRRPAINELNPSIDYNDPYNLRFGNPVLVPQLADNFDWNTGLYKGKFYANASVGYNYVTNIIQSIRTLIPGDKTQITFQNITDRKEYEASIWGGYTFSKKLRMNTSAGYTYNVYSAYDRQVNKYRNGGTFYTSLNYNFIFTDRISIDGNIRYNSIADAQGRSRSSVTQNIGVQTKWLNKQLTIGLSFIDFLSQQQFTSFTYGSNFTLRSESASRTRNLRLSVGYNLKKNSKKAAAAQKKKLMEKVNLLKKK